jgi:hypothetical protein
MKRKALLTLAAILAFGITAGAQGLGVNAGVNFFNQTMKSNGNKVDDLKMLTGFHIGVDYEIGVAPDFYFAPGLVFATKGAKIQEDFLGEEYTSKWGLNYLEVPLNLVYKPVLGTGNLIVNFGPYLGYGIGGKVKAEFGDEDFEEDINFGSGEDDDLKPFDMGANIGFGYQLGMGLSFKLNAQLGLINILPDGDSDNLVKNNGFAFSVGYRF